MKAAIYNPYLDTLGGGERYVLTFAKVLLDLGWKVDLEWKNPEIKTVLEKRFKLNLSQLNIVPGIKKGDGYDLCFWVSDGSIPTLRSRKNIIHFQVPFKNVNGQSLLNKMKLIRINKIICNSEFTKKVIDSEYGVNSLVVYPPVDTLQIKPKRKENIILFVGRFSALKQSKRQDILIEAFKKFYDGGHKTWKLILAGGGEVGSDILLYELKSNSVGYPIDLQISPTFDDLKKIYGISKLFWSASGYGENEINNPEKVEHFGISIVESMSAGCIPIVFNAGGHKEIVKNGKNGFLWNSTEELIEYSDKLINNTGLYKEIEKNALNYSKKFDYENFKEKIKQII